MEVRVRNSNKKTNFHENKQNFLLFYMNPIYSWGTDVLPR